MRYRVLGTVALLGPDEEIVDVPGDKLRSLLSVLLLRANNWVDTDVIVDAVWGPRAPDTVRRSLRTNIWQLRKLLDTPGAEESVIEGRTGGYRLNVARSELDTWLFEDLVTEGRAAVSRGDGHQAADMLLSALSLWRGQPFRLLPELADAESARLGELRWTARKALADALLSIDETGDAIAVLRAVLAEDPLREPFWARLVSALHAADRRAEALEAYQQARTVLVDELGMEPGADLRAAHQRVLAEEPRPAPVALRPAPPKPAPAPLQPDVRNFLPVRPSELLGREDELQTVQQMARTHAAARKGSPLLVLVDGMPGSGKTAFVTELAHRLAAGYPDAQLFLDLRGHRYGVIPTADALHTLLDTLGSGPIADGLEARTAQWRASLAGKRAVLVVDDVADAEQLGKLLPSSSAGVVLVTSRKRLPAPFGAVRIQLEPLPVEAAVRVLTGGLDLRDDEQALAAEVADGYGRLPAAMRVLNDRLRHRQGWSMHRVANHMRKPATLLGTLRTGDYDLTVAFDSSYRRLDAASRRMLRLLGASASLEFDLHAAAALADLGVGDVEPMLDDLVEHNLVVQPSAGRYRLHTLQRVFAAGLAGQEDSPRRLHLAQARLLAYYLRCTMHAVAVARSQPTDPDVADIPFAAIASPASAQRWLRQERSNLLAVADIAGGSSARRLRALVVGIEPELAEPEDREPKRQKVLSPARLVHAGTFTAAAAAVAFAAGSPAGLTADHPTEQSALEGFLDGVTGGASSGSGQVDEWKNAPEPAQPAQQAPAAPNPDTPRAAPAAPAAPAPQKDAGYVGKHRAPAGESTSTPERRANPQPDVDRPDSRPGEAAEDAPVEQEHQPPAAEQDEGLVTGTTNTATSIVTGERSDQGRRQHHDGPPPEQQAPAPEQDPEQASEQQERSAQPEPSAEDNARSDRGSSRDDSGRTADSEASTDDAASTAEDQQTASSTVAEPQQSAAATAQEPPAGQPAGGQLSAQPAAGAGSTSTGTKPAAPEVKGEAKDEAPASGGTVGAPPGGNYYQQAANQLAKNFQDAVSYYSDQATKAFQYFTGQAPTK